MKTLLSLDEPPTAIIAMSSEGALGALMYCQDNHVRIPEDISLVCFGNIENQELLYVDLTIATTNLKGIGNKMGELLLDRIQSKDELPNREVRFVSALSEGHSTSPVNPPNGK